MSDDEFFHKEKDNIRYLQKVLDKKQFSTPISHREETKN